MTANILVFLLLLASRLPVPVDWPKGLTDLGFLVVVIDLGQRNFRPQDKAS
jgi:hypothetical protein